MATVASWSGNGLSPGTMNTSSVGVGDTPISAVAEGITISATGSRPPQILFTPPSSGVECVVEWDFPAQTGGAGRFYLTTPAALPSSGQIPYFFEMHSGASRRWSLDFTSTGRFNLRSNTTVLQQGPAGLVQTSTTYRVEWMYDNTSNQVVVHFFVGESETSALTLTGAATNGATHTRVRIGRMNGAQVQPYAVDDLAVTDTLQFIGPHQTMEPTHYLLRDGAWRACTAVRL